MGERLVDANRSFRLLLATRCATPVLPPAAAALLTVANFSVTRAGLESEEHAPCVRPEMNAAQKDGRGGPASAVAAAD